MSQLHTVTDQKYAPLFQAWMQRQLGVTFDPAETRYVASVAETEDGFEIASCTALNRWTEGACEAHVAAERRRHVKVTPHGIYTTFDYAFRHAGKNCMLTYVSVDNARSLALQEMLGFTKIGLVPGYYGEGKDAHLFSMTKQQWLDGKWASFEAPTQE